MYSGWTNASKREVLKHNNQLQKELGLSFAASSELEVLKQWHMSILLLSVMLIYEVLVIFPRELKRE